MGVLGRDILPFMPKYYGFECELCEEIIALGKLGPDDEKFRTFYAAPLTPIGCPACGGSYQYGTDDLFRFEAEENIEQFPARTKARKPKL